MRKSVYLIRVIIILIVSLVSCLPKNIVVKADESDMSEGFNVIEYNAITDIEK